MTALWDWTLVLACAVPMLLGGCAAPGGPPPERVLVPTPVSCLPADIPSPPVATSDAVLAKMTPRQRYLSIAADREAAKEWLARWGPAIDACKAR